MGLTGEQKEGIVGGIGALASLIGGVAASAQLRKGEKRVKATDEQSLSAIAKEKAIKPTDRMQNMAFLKEGDENARKQKAIAKRGVAGGAISIHRAVGNNYVDAVKKIAASISARRKYLQDIEDNVSRAKTQRDNYFSDAKANAWATVSDDLIGLAKQFANSAGELKEKPATPEKPNTPNTMKVTPTYTENENGTITTKLDISNQGIDLKELKLHSMGGK
jgi:heme exporter protein D